jgi:predicted lactoylglutathione lyase
MVKQENLVYLIVTVVVIILTTIKQFNKQEQKKADKDAEILNNLGRIEKQNVKILNLLDLHSQDIYSLKKDVTVLENRVSRLEDSHVNLYKKIGGKENDTY